MRAAAFTDKLAAHVGIINDEGAVNEAAPMPDQPQLKEKLAAHDAGVGTGLVQSGDKSTLALLSAEATFGSLEKSTSYVVGNLGAPIGCSVKTTPIWFSYYCPINLASTSHEVDCNKPPPLEPTLAETAAHLAAGLFYRIRHRTTTVPEPDPLLAKLEKPDSSKGIVAHSFAVHCPASKDANAALYRVAPTGGVGTIAAGVQVPVRTWERLVPSVFDELPSVVDNTKLALMPFLWLQRRYAGDTLMAQDPIKWEDHHTTMPLINAEALDKLTTVEKSEFNHCHGSDW